MINYTIKSDTGLCAGKNLCVNKEPYLIAIGAIQYELATLDWRILASTDPNAEMIFKLIPGVSHMNIRRKNLREREKQAEIL